MKKKIKVLLIIICIILIGIGLYFAFFNKRDVKKESIIDYNDERLVYIKSNNILKIRYNQKYKICNNMLCSDIETSIISIEILDDSKKTNNKLIGLNIYEGINDIVSQNDNKNVIIYYTSPYFNIHNVNDYDEYLMYYFDYVDEELIKDQKDYYIVSFDTSNGTKISSLYVKKDATIKEPNVPKMSGNTFVEWQLNGVKYDFDTKINNNTLLTAKWQQKNFIIEVSNIDSQSPDRILTVFEENDPINFKEIKYTDGVLLCKGHNPTVSKSDLYGETEFIVVLEDNIEVFATLK